MKFKSAVLVVTAIMLSGCFQAPSDKIEHVRTEVKLNVKLFDSENELNEYHELKYPNSPKVHGYAVWYKNDPTNECTVHLVKGVSTNLERTYGHELMHCIYGSFHEE